MGTKTSSPSGDLLEKFDFVIVGSGFGGSVTAMRLAQKGYSVALVERGKRWGQNDFPKSNWQVRKYLWAPLLRCFGPQSISLLNGVMVLHGTGFGGGSLIYANTLMEPPSHVFKSHSWPKGLNWESELKPYYDLAKKMLGVTPNPKLMDSDLTLLELAKSFGQEENFHPTDVGVFFGAPEVTQPDPYFKGQGPPRAGCNFCGGCMVGCRYNSKNTLDKNYLFFAEKWGCRIFTEVKADRIEYDPNGEYRFRVELKSTTSSSKKAQVLQSRNLVLSAGVLGTLNLLFRNKFIHKTLPELPQSLGQSVRTNGESLLGSTSFNLSRDFSKGLAIGAAFHVDAETKIETVRYPAGSSAMRLLAVPLTSGGPRFLRILKMLVNLVVYLPQILRTFMGGDWARRSIILLVMRSVDEKFSMGFGRSPLSPFKPWLRLDRQGTQIPSYLEVAQESARRVAKSTGGFAQNVFSEVALGTPATAHILGGCPISDEAATGPLDLNHEMRGHPGLFVMDGSVVPSNLAVNPSLTITALAERFCQRFPPKTGEEKKVEFSS